MENANIVENTAKLSELKEIINTLLGVLDARSQDIVTRRYGLKTGKIETLDSIGKEYGVTRERVRQIEAQAKKLVACRKELLEAINAVLRDVFRKHGGVLTEEYLMKVLEDSQADKPEQNTVIFFLDILPRFERVTKSNELGPHWSHPELHNRYNEQVISEAQGILTKKKKPLEEATLLQKIREKLEITGAELPNECIKALLEASKKLKRTVFGEWGLIEWVETSPRGVGDKAFIVLKRSGKPMHFDEITNQINEVSFDHKVAHRQTVHNELIKDDRFVLVGRGLYGLSDWGYIPGTVADVMTEILKEANKPLTREELIEEVLKQRLVKRTTVLLGLQNRDRFERMPGEKYRLKQ